MADNKDSFDEKMIESQGTDLVKDGSVILSFDGQKLDVEKTKVSVYNFSEPSLFSPLELVFFQQIYQEWLRAFRTYLTLTLKTDIQLGLVHFEVESHSEFFKRVSEPIVVVLLGDVQRGNIGFWTFPTLLVLEIVRKLLGGTGKEKLEPRPLTAIEKSLFLQFIEGCLDHFAKNIYTDIKIKNLKVLGIELGLRFIPKSNKPLETYFSQISDWSLEENKFNCGFAIPCTILEPVLLAFREERSKLDPKEDRKKCFWRDVYKNIDVPVTAEWEKEVSVKDFMSWKEGTVLDFSMNTLERTVLKANGISKFIGILGIESGRIIFNVGEKYNERGE